MNLAEIKRRLPPRTVGFLVAGAVIAAGFMAVFIVPDYHAAGELRRDIEHLRSSLALRRQFAPAIELLKQAREHLRQVGPVGGKGSLPLSDVGRLNTIFGDMVTPLGLRLTRVSPDPSSVTRKGLLAVRLGLSGPAEAFREFMLTLGRYGPLVTVESVSTVAGEQGREYAMKCWLAIK
ncbi:conserved hypothetical protein [Solidesulfovibrio fructosivorans JJ]]|uniref:General secretion pathway protein M n=1 Tax=Solidesulfovibrio fructosivorans JJ] TaxID=596151 RepID=E1K0G5_SOLFR|nr:hypothetical protein [Solidesulfovibrio fructosivorans]EFL49908.1 conserved hypothetical protein [Solidesulfovibrio fructosivorans JJ]]